MVGFPSLRARLERRLKTTLAGTDLEALVRNRDRRRLRWLCQESTDPLLRFRALRALSELIDPQSQDIFLRMVHLPAGEVPTIELCIAAQSLARLVCRESTAPLIRLLETSRPVAVNLAAARALASLGSPADWEAVRRWVERSAVEGLTYPDLRDLLYPDEVSEPANQSAVFVLQVLYPEKGLQWWASKAATWLGSSEAARASGERVGWSHRAYVAHLSANGWGMKSSATKHCYSEISPAIVTTTSFANSSAKSVFRGPARYESPSH